jgi:hypothetical protein
MSDRVNCTLDLWGITTREKFEAICQAISIEESWDIDEVRDALDARNAFFEEVDGGDINWSIDAVIKASGLGYCWDWGQGVEYQEGFEVYDPRSGEHLTCLTVKQDIHVPLDKVEDADFVARARRARQIARESAKLPLIVADTSHEYLDAVTKHPELKTFVQEST